MVNFSTLYPLSGTTKVSKKIQKKKLKFQQKFEHLVFQYEKIKKKINIKKCYIFISKYRNFYVLFGVFLYASDQRIQIVC